MNSSSRILAEVKSKRLAGDFNAAASEINQLIKAEPRNSAALVEAIKIYLLTSATEQARKLYSVARKLPDVAEHWEPGLLLRLQQLTSDLEIPDLEQLIGKSDLAWCREFLRTGQDLEYPISLKNYRVTCLDGTITFHFEGECPSCRTEYHTQVYMTFLIRRQTWCPVCFARNLLDCQAIETFLESRFMSEAERKITELDHLLRKLQFQLDADAGEYKHLPRLCNYLGQDYVFALNEFLIRRLSTEK